MKERLKHTLGQTIFGSHLAGLLLRNTAVIVAFHRVRNEAGSDPLTVSVPLFERYCRFFTDFFQVVPLRAIVERLERGEKLNSELAITFDDGYLDNFENAAPVLETLSLPATFFVVTHWIGTDLVAWWDRADHLQHRWMTWDHVRSLHSRGFDIGAHTRTHMDLGSADATDAEREILGARRDLECQLNASVDLFAYPYGRRENLCDTNRELIKAAGFRCCCSCFGGVVTARTDPFHLSRVPVSPRYPSPHEFGFDVAVGRSVIGSETSVCHTRA